jgi:hypothetical protein
LTSEVIGSSKIPTHGVTLDLDAPGSLLQIIADSEHITDYRMINLAKFKIELNGLDQDGYLRLRIVPKIPERVRKRSASESHTHGEQVSKGEPIQTELTHESQPTKVPKRHVARLDPGFSLYSERTTDEGSIRKICRNQADFFILIVESPTQTRKYTIGSSDEPTTYLGRLMALLRKENKPMSFKEIHDLLRVNHMSDPNKLRAALEILTQEIELIYDEGDYAIPLEPSTEDNAKPKLYM